MDLNGYIALSDAQIREADAEAEQAGKYAQAALTWQSVDKQAIANYEATLKLKWDARAHAQLLRRRNQALQRANTLRIQGEQLRAKLSQLTWLMAGGGDWERVRDGWLAFEYVRLHLPFTAAARAADVKPAFECYEASAWRHPTDPATVPYGQPHDPGALLDWARRHTYFPVFDGAAWDWLNSFLTALDTAAELEAQAIQSRMEAAEKAASELEAREWERLKPAKDAAP